jgi:hypothetical protein
MSLMAGTGAVVARHLTPEPERELPRDPVLWVRDVLDEHPWSMQRRILRSVVENRRTGVPSAHGTGKSWTASRVAAWWIAAHEPGEAFVVTSAPSVPQIKAILWRELARAHRKGGLAGRITGLAGSGPVEWHLGPKGAEELVAFGRKPQDLTDLDQARAAFQGIHARYVLVVLDEATGVPSWLWEAASSLLTNEAARILAIGNPDDAATQFGEVCQPGSGWNILPVSAFDTPAFTGEVVPEVVREGLVSRLWVEEAERDYGGKDNPLYKSKVLGLFPDTSEDHVITPAMVREARARDLPGVEPGAYGLDVSRFGKDETVLYRVRGGVARKVDGWKGLPITAAPGGDGTVERTYRHVSRTPAVPVVVDADGLGAGAYDGLVALRVLCKPFTLNAAPLSPKFDTRRSEVWWTYRQRMLAGEVDLDPDDDVLAAQLQQPKWSQDAKGRICVERKEQMAKRGVKSPDHADAVIMADVGAPPVFPKPAPAELLRQAAERDRRAKEPPGPRVDEGEVARLRRRPM